MRTFCLIFFLLTLFSCNPSENSMLIIDPRNFSEDQFKLSYIAENISYIPLDDTIPLGIVYAIEINSYGIYVNAKNIGILLYDKYGKFLRYIARRGRGPGELLYGTRFTVDKNTGVVYVIDLNEIKVYSSSGYFLKIISINKYASSPASDIEIFGEYLFLPYYGLYENPKLDWLILDTLGNLVSKKEDPIQSSGFLERGGIYKFQNNLFYFNKLNDSIFAISPNLEVNLAYLFAKGDFRWPKDFIPKSISQTYRLFKPGNMFETKRFIFLEYSYLDRNSELLFDKKNNKTYQACKQEKVGIVNYTTSIENDLDGGLSFTPNPFSYYYYTENDSEYIVSMINPFELIEHIISDVFINTIPNFPQKKKELKQLANSLDEDDNPVLMIVKLKE